MARNKLSARHHQWPVLGGAVVMPQPTDAQQVPPQQQHQQLVDPPMKTTAVASKVHTAVQQQQPSSINNNNNISNGQRLAQHLLLRSNSNSLHQQQQDDHHSLDLMGTLAQIVAQPNSTNMTELDVVWWLVLELLWTTTVAVAAVSSTSSSKQRDEGDPMQVDGEEEEMKEQTTEKDPAPSTSTDHQQDDHSCALLSQQQQQKQQRMMLLLVWLHDALSFSPTVCQFLTQGLPNQPSPKPERRCCLRVSNINRNARLQQTEERLQSPLWSKGVAPNCNSRAISSAEPTATQRRTIQRWWDLLQNISLLQQESEPVAGGPSLWALRTLKQLYSRSNDNYDSATFADALLDSWTTVATHVLKRNYSNKTSTQQQHSRSTSAPEPVPLRLLQKVSSDEQNNNSNTKLQLQTALEHTDIAAN